MSPFDPTAIIDPNGWDMVIGVPLTVVNDALRQSAVDLSFSYSSNDGGQSVSLFGTFDPWSFAGGVGQDLSIILPIASGTANVSGSASNPFDLPPGCYDLSGLSVTVTTRLQFVTNKVPEQFVRLTFDFDGASNTPDFSPSMPDGGSVSGGNDLPPLLQQMLPAMIASCLAANIKEMDLVFATITAALRPTSQDASNGRGEWQYAVASQQGITDHSLAIFYSANPSDGLNATIPESIGPQNDQCVVVLSQAVTLSSVILPVILYGLNHTNAPMPADCALDLVSFGPASQSNSLQADQFISQVGPAGSNTAAIFAKSPINLNLGTFVPAPTATLSNFYCVVTGQNLTISFDAQTSMGVNFDGSSSKSYRLTTGKQWNNGQQVFGIRLFPLPSNTNQSSDAMQLAIFNAISAGLESAPLPVSFSLFSGQTVQLEAGYLNGGLGLVGSISVGNAP